MKKFSDYKKERESILYVEKVEMNHQNYQQFVDNVLLEMGVSSPVELSQERYKEYLLKLENYQPNVISQKKEVKKKFSLTLEQKDMIKELIGLVSLQEAAKRLNDILGSKMPDIFKGVSIQENTLKVTFKDVEYTFEKAKQLLEKDIKSDDDFKEYATTVLKKAHGDKFKQDVADKMISDIIKKYKGDYGKMIGVLTSGLR